MTWSTGSTLEHPARVALGVVDEGIDGLAEANLWSLSDQELLGLRIAQEATLARLHAQILATTREVDRRGAAVAVGAPSTAGWLRGRCGLHYGAAKREVQLAGELDSDTAGAARRSGRRGGVAGARRGWWPTGSAACPPRWTRRPGPAARRIWSPRPSSATWRRWAGWPPTCCTCWTPRARPAWSGKRPTREVNEEFTLIHRHDGGRGFRGQLTDEDGAFIDAALDVLAAPRPAEDGTPDPRPAGKRRADALMDLVRIALTAQEMPESGGEPVTVTVITGPEHLQADNQSGAETQTDPPAARCRVATPARRPGAAAGTSRAPAAHLEDGTPLSPETTRRLSCDAWLVAAILDAHGAVLDIGRRSRIVPAPMRRAVIVRDGGCAFPGCGRPSRWCQAHHIWHWSKGGPTALDNLVLLCAHHHNVVHHHGWQVHLDKNRLPVFTPPPWIDPDQAPRAAWRPPLHLLV